MSAERQEGTGWLALFAGANATPDPVSV